MAAMPASCGRSAVFSCSSSTIGVSSRAAARHDLLEIFEERYGRRSTIITSQIPMDKWHDIIGDPTYADAILDRIVHTAHRINLTGHSLRRSRTSKATQALTATPPNAKK
jgi:DNA replication protein DnaC